MSIFSKLFGRKKEDYGRVSSVERFERTIARPITFLTEHGGSSPLEYDMDTRKAMMMKEESIAYLQKAIESGCIDEYSDLSIFYDMVRKRSIIVENDLTNQNISRKNVGRNIKVVTAETFHKVKGKERQLRAERQLLSDVMDYKDNDTVNEKGLGDEYEKD